MTYEEAKKELKSYRYNLLLFDKKIDEIANMQSLAEKTITVLSSGSKMAGVNSDKVGDCVSDIIDLKNELVQVSNDLINSLKVIRGKISKLETPYSTIIDLIYIENKSLVEIASDVGYSYPQIKRILKKSINLYKMIPNEIE